MHADGSVTPLFDTLSESQNDFVGPPRLRWIDGLGTEREHIYGIRTAAGAHQINVGIGDPSPTDRILYRDDGNSDWLWRNNVITANADLAANVGLTGVFQDLVTITPDMGNGGGFAVIAATCEFSRGASASLAVGQLSIDGVIAAEQIVFQVNAICRAAVSQVYMTGLGSGVHTIKLQAEDTGGAAITTAVAPGTRLSMLGLRFI